MIKAGSKMCTYFHSVASFCSSFSTYNTQKRHLYLSNLRSSARNLSSTCLNFRCLVTAGKLSDLLCGFSFGINFVFGQGL